MAETGTIGRAFGGRLQDDGIGAPLYSGYNGPVEMLPNPDFVFPMREASTETAPPIPPMSSRRAPPPSFGARRGSAQSARKSISALPDFSFNPSGSEPVSVPAMSSPQPTTPTMPSHGHRRGGSEFIGGDSKASVVGLMSTSPTKGDGILPPPAPGLRPGPPAGRRGHAHRRSGAISCHDLSNIMQSRSPNPSHGSSAPATPAESDISAWPSHQVNRSISQPSLQRIGASDDAPSLPSPDSSPQRPLSRARVGFSDKVEYIRPLSTISSETEGSMSTLRGHSVSNSLSSVASIGAPSPPSARRRPAPLSAIEGRPSTASAVFDSRSEDLLTQARPTSLISPTSSMSSFGSPLSTPNKKRHFFQLTSRQSGTMDSTIRASTSEPSLAATADSPPGSPSRQTSADDSDDDGDRNAAQRRSTRTPRKVKSWVSSLISREPKAHDARQRRPPTPPVPALPVENEAALMANFDEDNTITIVTPTSEQVPTPKVQTDIAAWKPRHMSPESDARSPVIDLDLAMSPYEIDRRSQPGSRASFTARRTMHSGAFQNSLQNHRRTESAPALVPFEGRSAAGGANVMAEVFEEEEEDDLHGATRNAVAPSSEAVVQADNDPARADSIDSANLNVGIQVVDSDAPSSKPVSWNFDDGLGIHSPSQDSTPRATRISSPVAPSPALQAETSPQCSPVEVVEDYEEPRASSLTRSSDSTITPSLDSDVIKETQPTMALPLPLPDHSYRTPDTFTDASFSTSTLSYRQSSLDTPRLGTSASSIADNRTLNSQLTSEPVPSLRISTDDVPSLTSSRSTATNGMPQPRSLVSPRTPAERTESVSSYHTTNSERRNKRASIVSLSRLMGVGGTFGEREYGRSKLNIEQRPQSEHMDLREFGERKEAKTKKTRRFSKMIQFWKSSKDTTR